MTNAPETSASEAAAGCGYMILGLLISPLLSVWKGYAFSVLWRWFIVATFDLRSLSIPASIGVIYVAQMLTFHFQRSPKQGRSELEEFIGWLAFSLLFPGAALGCGALVHRWM